MSVLITKLNADPAGNDVPFAAGTGRWLKTSGGASLLSADAADAVHGAIAGGPLGLTAQAVIAGVNCGDSCNQPLDPSTSAGYSNTDEIPPG